MSADRGEWQGYDERDREGWHMLIETDVLYDGAPVVVAMEAAGYERGEKKDKHTGETLVCLSPSQARDVAAFLLEMAVKCEGEQAMRDGAFL